ncbi:MAG: DNA polymerase III subunit delta, partial [Alphaproteobacteria bacterium]
MMGGEKVVWVRSAEDGPTAKALTLFLDDPKGDALIVIEAGDLSPRAALRKLAEGSDLAAALPCYEDDARSIEQIIAETLRAEGLNVSPDAMTYLAARLGADRAITRTELQKLALYMGNSGAEVSAEDAEAVIGDLSALALDAIIDSAFSGDVRTLDQTILRAFAENISEIAILRMAIGHLEKLASVAAAMAEGQSADQAIKGLRPPLYFKRQNAFRQQVGRWPHNRIATARALLYDAERDCKTTGLPTQAVCHRALLRLAVAARRAR